MDGDLVVLLIVFLISHKSKTYWHLSYVWIYKIYKIRTSFGDLLYNSSETVISGCLLYLVEGIKLQLMKLFKKKYFSSYQQNKESKTGG